jgi:hypothetical protein
MRWWLASVLAGWAHSLTYRDGGDAWFEEFAFAYLRARRCALGEGATATMQATGRGRWLLRRRALT